MRGIILSALGVLILSQSPVFAQMGPDIFVYEEATGNLPGPFTISGIPFGLWSLLYYSSHRGTGNGDDEDPPPPPNPCSQPVNISKHWDEILMFPEAGSSEYTSFPMNGRWGNYFAASWSITRDRGTTRNPRMTALVNNVTWRNFNSVNTHEYGYETVVYGYLDTASHETGSLMIKAELEIQCGTRAPYVEAQTYQLPMVDPNTIFFQYVREVMGSVHDEILYACGPIETHTVNFPGDTHITSFGEIPQQHPLTLSQIISEVDSQCYVTIRPSSVIPAEIFNLSPNEKLVRRYRTRGLDFDLFDVNYLGQPQTQKTSSLQTTEYDWFYVFVQYPQ